jgi:hypothetical protein
MLYLQGQALNLFDNLRGGCQILRTILGDVDVVLNAHSSHAPVPLQYLGIDVFASLWGLQNRVNDETAEIDLVNELVLTEQRWDGIILRRAQR